MCHCSLVEAQKVPKHQHRISVLYVMTFICRVSLHTYVDSTEQTYPKNLHNVYADPAFRGFSLERYPLWYELLLIWVDIKMLCLKGDANLFSFKKVF